MLFVCYHRSHKRLLSFNQTHIYTGNHKHNDILYCYTYRMRLWQHNDNERIATITTKAATNYHHHYYKARRLYQTERVSSAFHIHIYRVCGVRLQPYVLPYTLYRWNCWQCGESNCLKPFLVFAERKTPVEFVSLICIDASRARTTFNSNKAKFFLNKRNLIQLCLSNFILELFILNNIFG